MTSCRVVVAVAAFEKSDRTKLPSFTHKLSPKRGSDRMWQHLITFCEIDLLTIIVRIRVNYFYYYYGFTCVLLKPQQASAKYHDFNSCHI